MSIKHGSKAVGLLFAAAAAAMSLAPVAEASPINYDFSVNVTSGPRSGTVANGSFSYDSSIAANASNVGTGLLTGLNFSFDGKTYDATTANTGWMAFDSTGNLTYFLFGSNCSSSGSCSITWGTDEWWIWPGANGFLYSVPGFIGTGKGNVTYALASVPVPEPSALGLFGFGVLLLGVAAWRRSAPRRLG